MAKEPDRTQIPLDQRERIAAFINEKWKDKRCPICENTSWSIAPHVLVSNIFSGGDISVGGPVYPIVIVLCDNCGYIHAFNAMKAGLSVAKEVSDG